MRTDEVRIQHHIDGAWLEMPGHMIGSVPTAIGTPDRYILVTRNELPLLRLDLYLTPDTYDHGPQAIVWNNCLVAGYSNCVTFLSIQDGEVTNIVLADPRRSGDYFMGFFPLPESLLVSSGCGLCCFGVDGRILWRNPDLGIDGVTVTQVTGTLITGFGEFDPPGGKRPFSVSLNTGRIVD